MLYVYRVLFSPRLSLGKGRGAVARAASIPRPLYVLPAVESGLENPPRAARRREL